MKRLLLLLLALPLLAAGQTFKLDPNYVKKAQKDQGYMLDTISESKLKKEQIYSNALSFITNRFKDSRSAIEMKDLELGEIKFKGNSFRHILVSDTSKKGKITQHRETVYLYFKCQIYIKDGKFKIVMNGLEKPFSAIINTGVNLPLDPFDKVQPRETKAASVLALSLLKDISSSLNKKPDNEF